MIEVPTIMKMADRGWVVAVKQSGGDILKLADLMQRVHATGSGLRVMSAIDALLFSTFLMGSHGTIGFTASVLPRLTLALWHACQSGQIERAQELHERMLPVVLLWQSCATDQESAMKAAIEVQGRHVGVIKTPGPARHRGSACTDRAGGRGQWRIRARPSSPLTQRKTSSWDDLERHDM